MPTVTARTVGLLILLSGIIQNKMDGVKLPFRQSFTTSIIPSKRYWHKKCCRHKHTTLCLLFVEGSKHHRLSADLSSHCFCCRLL